MVTKIIIAIIFFSAFFLALESIKRNYKIDSSITRKIAHIFCAISAIIFFIYFTKEEFILSLIFFTAFFIVSYSQNYLKSIHLQSYKTFGEVLYPISLILLSFFYFENKFVIITSIAIMGLADASAGLYDNKFSRKTFTGRFIFSAIALIISILSAILFKEISIGDIVVKSAFISAIITAIEFLSPCGSDNITVPISAALLLDLFF